MEEKNGTGGRVLSTEEKRARKSSWRGSVNPFAGFRRDIRRVILILLLIVCAALIAGAVFLLVRFGLSMPDDGTDDTLTFTTYASFKAYMEDGEDGFVGSAQVLKDENGFVLCEYHANRRGIERIEYLGTTDKYLPIRVTPAKVDTPSVAVENKGVVIACAVLIGVILAAGAVVTILVVRADRAETKRRRGA